MILRAASIDASLDLPLITREEAANLRVLRDGVPQKNAVAYDLDRQLVWRYKTDLDGHYLIVDEHIVLEEVGGLIEVERKRNGQRRNPSIRR